MLVIIIIIIIIMYSYIYIRESSSICGPGAIQSLFRLCFDLQIKHIYMYTVATCTSDQLMSTLAYHLAT